MFTESQTVSRPSPSIGQAQRTSNLSQKGKELKCVPQIKLLLFGTQFFLLTALSTYVANLDF